MSEALYKLGKLPAKKLLGLPAISKYTVTLPSPPPSCYNSTKLANLGLMGNDAIGDCTAAGVGHAIQTWTSLTRSAEVTLSDSVIINLYSKVSGYIPGEPMTDNGAVASDVLRYWYNNPNDVDGHRLVAFASVKPGDKMNIMHTIWMCGVCYTGIQLPLTAQSGNWEVAQGASIQTGDSAAGSWGGHCVSIVDYDANGLTCITWGSLKKMSWSFFNSYCDESYAILSPDWIEDSGRAPPGFDLPQLMLDMQALRG